MITKSVSTTFEVNTADTKDRFVSLLRFFFFFVETFHERDEEDRPMFYDYSHVTNTQPWH